MAVVLILVLLVVGSVVFHLLSPWWWTPIASNWSYIDTTLIITFWITGAVFVAVVCFMAYCVYAFRHRPGIKAVYEPENRRLEWMLASFTGVGVAAMLAPGLVVWKQFVSVPEDAATVEVVAQQWLWSFRLPGADGKLGRAGTHDITAENPLGIDRNDAAGLDDVIIEGGELHLPLNKPVRMLLRSIDVVHDFYVPEFRAKMDMIPGMITYFWLTPTRTGSFEVLCAELCGIGHPQMRGIVVVDDEETYRGWLEQQQTFTQLLASAEVGSQQMSRTTRP